MKRITIALLITMMVIGISSVSYAGHGQRGHGGGMGGNPLLFVPWEKIVEVANEIGLTENQKDALKTIRKDFREINGDLHVDMRNSRLELSELMVTAEASDLSNALKLADQTNVLQGKLMKNSIKAIFEMKKILTPEQLQHFRDIAKERRGQRKGNRDQKQQRGGGRNRQ